MNTTTEFLSQARRAGWRSKVTGGGHIRLEHPEASAPVIIAATPGDPRSLRNSKAQMKRALRREVTK